MIDNREYFTLLYKYETNKGRKIRFKYVLLYVVVVLETFSRTFIKYKDNSHWKGLMLTKTYMEVQKQPNTPL